MTLHIFSSGGAILKIPIDNTGPAETTKAWWNSPYRRFGSSRMPDNTAVTNDVNLVMTFNRVLYSPSGQFGITWREPKNAVWVWTAIPPEVLTQR